MVFPNPLPINCLFRQRTTSAKVYLLLAALLLVVQTALGAEAPRFRKPDQTQVISPLTAGVTVTLLADADFAPFSFRGANGQASGLAVDLALLSCAELKISCSIKFRRFQELVPALLRKDGDVVVSGPKLTDQLLNTVAMTRPYFWSSGRFIVKKDLAIASTDPSALNSVKLGFVEGTGHAAFVRRHYEDGQLVPLASLDEVHSALKRGEIDAAFEDNLAASFWLAGKDSAGCCRALGGPLVDRNTISHNMSYLVRRDEGALLKALDMALDRLQDNGATAKLFARYLPANYW